MKRKINARSVLRIATLLAVLFSISAAGLAVPQGYPEDNYPDYSAPPPILSPVQLDQLVARIALYPDPLLAQVLAAATYPDQIPDAAAWADDHHYLQGQQLADAIYADQLPWDPSVQALLPFPSVLGMMASDMNWTTQLGDAFLAQQVDVQNAIQRQRQLAYQYGYLRSNPQIAVTYGPYITIMPANPGYIVVPAYDPRIVYFPPRPGFFVGGALRFGFGITIGGFFRPWGWDHDRFDWGRHEVIINNSPWRRDWRNRAEYQHPYPSQVRRYSEPPRDEFRGRTEVEHGRIPEARRPEQRPEQQRPIITQPADRGQGGRPEQQRPEQQRPIITQPADRGEAGRPAQQPRPEQQRPIITQPAERGPAAQPEQRPPTQSYVRPTPGREQHQPIARSQEERAAPQSGNQPPAEQHRGEGRGNQGNRR